MIAEILSQNARDLLLIFVAFVALVVAVRNAF